eukprot:356120-Chlamydomonas_euryale.AAC.3
MPLSPPPLPPSNLLVLPPTLPALPPLRYAALLAPPLPSVPLLPPLSPWPPPPPRPPSSSTGSGVDARPACSSTNCRLGRSRASTARSSCCALTNCRSRRACAAASRRTALADTASSPAAAPSSPPPLPPKSDESAALGSLARSFRKRQAMPCHAMRGRRRDFPPIAGAVVAATPADVLISVRTLNRGREQRPATAARAAAVAAVDAAVQARHGGLDVARLNAGAVTAPSRKFFARSAAQTPASPRHAADAAGDAAAAASPVFGRAGDGAATGGRMHACVCARARPLHAMR